MERHAQDVIDTLLTEGNPTGVSYLVTILMFQNKGLITSILADSKLNVKATEVLSNKDVSETVIARLATLTLSAMTTCPEEAPAECGFIYHLLPHVANHSVFNMFMSLLGECDRFAVAQRWLADFGFVEYILRELDMTDYEHGIEEGVDLYYDPVFYKTNCLYLMIGKCSLHSIFGPQMKTKSTIESMKKRFKEAPPYVWNSYWKALCALCDETTAEEMACFHEKAMEALQEEKPKLYEYQVCSILFLEKLIHLVPKMASQLLQSSVSVWLIQLLLKFPNSTILHSAFRKFVVTGMDNKEFAMNFLSLYAPMIVTEAMSCENKVLKPTLIFLIERIRDLEAHRQEYRDIMNNVPQFREFLHGGFVEYQKLSNEQYGGRLSKVTAFLSQLFD